jgi:phosphoglucomutase
VSITESNLHNNEVIVESLKSMILSASGWRKVFAIDGGEESTDPGVSAADCYLAAAAAYAYGRRLQEESGKDNAVLLLSADTRPTGPFLLAVCQKIFTGIGLDVRTLSYCTLPEVMAAVRVIGELDGFFYISASHNPPGYNGFKFGFADGAIVGGHKSREIIKVFKDIILNNDETFFEFFKTFDFFDSAVIADAAFAEEVRNAYMQAMMETIGNDKLRQVIKNTLVRRPLGIVADYNGSARIGSIDRQFLAAFGIGFTAVNDEAGVFSHRIIPEGESLTTCCQLLDRRHSDEQRFILGFVPDCDGDRGNIVYFNEHSDKALILDAQTVFALSCVSELAYLKWLGHDMSKTAVVANCATSLRVNEICRSFGAVMANAETGEANVVAKAAQLREAGYTVRILGEGSNGGNITYPNLVRDPLSTLSSLIKLYAVRSEGNKKGLFALWAEARGLDYSNAFQFADIVASLPAYTTTSIAEEYAAMRARKGNKDLKAAFEKVFEASWPQLETLLVTCDKKQAVPRSIQSYKFVNYEETEVREGPLSRTGDESGGLRVMFYDAAGRAQGFMWMRKSKTEPLMRLMVDISGSSVEDEVLLRTFLRTLLAEADRPL